jgi:hypothetical protein
MPVIQNISLPAGDDVEITFNIDDDTVIDLSGAAIYWYVYPQEYGIPDTETPVLMKSTDLGSIAYTGSPPDEFVVTLLGDDTKDMLRNYYHEACVEDVNGQRTTVTVGIFTVTQTEIASGL